MFLTSKEASAEINNSIEQLCTDLAKGSSNSLKAYLDFASKMPSYSLRNQALIRIQMSTASKVATFKQWQALGRSVKTGEKSKIKLLRPNAFKKEVTKNGKKEEQSFLCFSLFAVFDISQTEGSPLPSFMPSIQGDDKGLYNTLKKAVIQSGIVVNESEALRGGALGMSFGKRIDLKKDTNISMFSTLVHEFAHEILHQGSENKSLTHQFKECQAEATAYIVMQYFGFETQMCVDYLAHYGNTAKEVEKNLNAIIKASQQVIGEIMSDLERNANNQTTEECTIAA